MPNKKNIITFLVLLAILIIYFFVYKLTGLAIQCPIHYLTNYYCPGCGVTRMLFSIIKLDFYQAFRFNPLVFILLVIYIIYFIIKYVFKVKINVPNKVIYSLTVVLIISKYTSLFIYITDNILTRWHNKTN